MKLLMRDFNVRDINVYVDDFFGNDVNNQEMED